MFAHGFGDIFPGSLDSEPSDDRAKVQSRSFQLLQKHLNRQDDDDGILCFNVLLTSVIVAVFNVD